MHFIHVKPPRRENQTVLPLMLVHGWPGSIYEFYKILPLLTQNHDGITFEVICPSIPGYGYSEAPHKQGRQSQTNACSSARAADVYRCASCIISGFNSLAAARVFLTLMERLGFSQFYLQGGDWGSLITTNMAQMKPQ